MPPPCRYTMATEKLITDAALTGEELRLLLFLRCHDLPDSANGGDRKGFVFVSRARCAERLHKGIRQISALLAGLETKGFIRREIQEGKVSRIVLLTPEPDILLHKTIKGEADPCREPSRVEEPTLGENSQGGLEQNLQKTLEQNGQPEDYNIRVQEKSTSPLASASGTGTPKKSPKKKEKTSKKPLTRHQRIIDQWITAYKEKTGKGYHVTGADAKQVKELAASNISTEDIFAKIDEYLDYSDEYVAKHGHSLANFVSQINRPGKTEKHVSSSHEFVDLEAL